MASNNSKSENDPLRADSFDLLLLSSWVIPYIAQSYSEPINITNHQQTTYHLSNELNQQA